MQLYAFHDTLTNLHNRFSGMLILEKLIAEKRKFALIFVDLDNLKYINDMHGHNEGDAYILKTAEYLKTFSDDTVVCRIGGDEFMLLTPDVGYDDAQMKMDSLNQALQNDEYLTGKDFFYNISFGICAVEEHNHMTASDILSIADERMYENKRLCKKARQNQNR